MSDDVWKRNEIESPCVNICLIHRETRLCVGCYRSVEEIGRWSSMQPEERKAIMAELKGRESEARPRRKGGRKNRRKDG